MEMVFQPHTRAYLDYIKEILIDEYSMTDSQASEAVESSSVKKMLYDEDEAIWQMRQPLEATAEDVYREYKGLSSIWQESYE